MVGVHPHDRLCGQQFHDRTVQVLGADAFEEVGGKADEALLQAGAAGHAEVGGVHETGHSR